MLRILARASKINLKNNVQIGVRVTANNWTLSTVVYV